MRLFFVFSILIFVAVAAKADSILLSWDAPTLREDGSNIESLDGYRLYSSVNGAETITNINASQLSHVLNDAIPGVHAFQISSVEDGLEGNKSPVVNVTIDPPPSPPNAAIIRVIIERCDSAGNCTQEVVE